MGLTLTHTGGFKTDRGFYGERQEETDGGEQAQRRKKVAL